MSRVIIAGQLKVPSSAHGRAVKATFSEPSRSAASCPSDNYTQRRTDRDYTDITMPFLTSRFKIRLGIFDKYYVTNGVGSTFAGDIAAVSSSYGTELSAGTS